MHHSLAVQVAKSHQNLFQVSPDQRDWEAPELAEHALNGSAAHKLQEDVEELLSSLAADVSHDIRMLQFA